MSDVDRDEAVLSANMLSVLVLALIGCEILQFEFRMIDDHKPMLCGTLYACAATATVDA